MRRDYCKASRRRRDEASGYCYAFLKANFGVTRFLNLKGEVMKKIFLIVLILTLSITSTAMAATEFSLGGFIKLQSFWDSSQEGKNMNQPILRNNNPLFHHGRLKFTAQASRFNFTIKGPKLWGANTNGFIEVDFDSAENPLGGASAANSYTPRLRHAMFRLNWPETELMFGQYWSMFSEWWPELVQDGPFMLTGIPVARLPQIRLTQKFAGVWRVAAMIGQANAAASSSAFLTTGGDSAEFPQIQGLVAYQQDLWGKSAYFGVPTPFTFQITAGIQRNDLQGTNNTAVANITPFGENGYGAAVAASRNNRYLYPWICMASTFIPVIPSHSANLAGTASLQTQWWIGQGVEAFGISGIASNLFHFSGTRDAAGNWIWDQQLQNRFGGYVQGQYYFTNDWFLNVDWAMSRAFGVSPGQQDPLSNAAGFRTYAVAADTMNMHQEFDVILWYRPIKALKFGLQYSYMRTNWFQNTQINGTAAVPQNLSKFGDAHRVQFVSFFFF